MTWTLVVGLGGDEEVKFASFEGAVPYKEENELFARLHFVRHLSERKEAPCGEIVGSQCCRAVQIGLKSGSEGKLKWVASHVSKGDRTIRKQVVEWANGAPYGSFVGVAFDLGNEKGPCCKVRRHTRLGVDLRRWAYDSENAKGVDDCVPWRGLEEFK